jgi:hypothetical protein
MSQVPYELGERALTMREPVEPFIGLLAVGAGTLLAMQMIPPGCQAAGALFPAAAIMSAGLLFAPILCLVRDPRAFFRLENLLMFGLVYWLLLDLLQGAYDLGNTSQTAVEKALLSVGLFAAGIWTAGLLPKRKLPQFVLEATNLKLAPAIVFDIAVLFFCLAMVNYLLACEFDVGLMFSSLAVGRWEAPWSRDSYGDWSAFRDHLQYFGYVLPTLTTVQLLQRGWKHPATIGCAVMSVTVLVFLTQSGGRRIIGVTVGAAILFWLLSHPRLQKAQMFWAACAVAALLAVLQVMFQYRSEGLGKVLQDREVKLTDNHVRVDDNFLRLAQTIDLVPDSYPYVYEKRLLYTLARPIPRVFWKDKPKDYGFSLAGVLTKQIVTLSASVIADWYVMGGLAIVFFGGLFYGCLSSLWSQLLAVTHRPAATLTYSLGCMAVFTSLRSLDELVLQSYMVFAWIGASLLMVRFQKKPDEFS